MKYNGTGWVYVGNRDFSAGYAQYTSIAIDTGGTPYVVYQDSVNGYKATVMKFNGTNWVTVGNAGFSADNTINTSIVIDSSGTLYVVYQDGATGLAHVNKFNGTNWVSVGSPVFSSTEGMYSASIAINGSSIPYVAYSDGYSVSGATVMKYDTIAAGITKINNLAATLTTFPDPNHGSFTLHISTITNEAATITITNMLGQQIKELTTITNTDTKIQLASPPGIYFISAHTQQGAQSSKVVIW